MKRNSLLIAGLGNFLLSGLFVVAGCGGGGGGTPPSNPGVFDLISPNSGDTVLPSPTLSWTASSSATSYTIDIASDSAFSTILHSGNVASLLTSYTVSTTLAVGSYYWRVSAANSGGTTSSSTPYYTFTVAVNGGLQWMKNSNPVSGQDAQAFALAIDSTSMYVVGYDYGAVGTDDQWRIEKRSLSTGEPDASFGSWQGHAGFVTSQTSTAGFEDVFSIVTDTTSGHMYLAGYESDASGNEKWRIEKRTLSTGQLDTQFDGDGIISEDTGTGGWNEAQAVALDSSSLYVAGYDAYGPNVDEPEQWRIEKRDLVSGNTDSNFGPGGIISDPTVTSPSAVNAIAVDAGHIYAVGYYAATPTEEGWYIEKRQKGTGAIVSRVTSSSGSAKALAIDGSYMYVAGYVSETGNTSWRIETRDLNTLNLVSVITSQPSDGSDVPNTIAVDDTYIYVAGYDSDTTDPDNKEQWRVEKYNKNTGAPDTAFGTGGAVSNNPSDQSDEIWGMALDATAIYLVGYDSNTPYNSDPDYLRKNTQWRIEKRSK